MFGFVFWQRWLVGVGVYLSIFGLVLAFFPQSSLLDIAFNNQIDPVFWDDGNIPDRTVPFQAWIYGVLGSMVCSWGILIAFLAWFPFKAREKWAWNCICTAVVFWFVIDTVLSAFYGVWFNVLFNVFLLLLLAAPLAATRKHFS